MNDPTHNSTIVTDNQNGDTTALIASSSNKNRDVPTPMEDDQPPPPPGYQDIDTLSNSIPTRRDIDGSVLQSQKQNILNEIKREIGSNQVSIGSVQFASSCLMDEAIQSELSAN